MKITRVETIVVNMPLVIKGAAPMMAGRPRTSMDTLYVRIDTDAGISGWGEAFGHRIWPATKAALDTLIAPMCIGRDASAIAALMSELQRTLHGVGRNGPAMYALSGIDIALWDIAGKAANLPLYRLLGGAPRADLPAYASLLRYGNAQAVAQNTAQARSRGYLHIKLHEITVPEVKAGREAAGPGIPLMIDTNCPWTVREAIAMSRAFQPYDPLWVEEPVFPPEDVAGLAAVRRATGMAIAAGENVGNVADFKRLFDAGAVTYAQPSITKVGGVSEMRKVLTLAEAFGVEVVPHSPYFGPGFLASVHVLATLARETTVERFYCDFAENPLGERIDPKNGRIGVPQTPGVGADPDPKLLEKLRVA
jgi:D-galactarolactone cycloisomerase